MNAMTKETVSLLEILPNEDQMLLNGLTKKLVRAWNPNFTKLTASEKKDLDEAITEVENGEVFTDEDVWNEK